MNGRNWKFSRVCLHVQGDAETYYEQKSIWIDGAHLVLGHSSFSFGLFLSPGPNPGSSLFFRSLFSFLYHHKYDEKNNSRQNSDHPDYQHDYLIVLPTIGLLIDLALAIVIALDTVAAIAAAAGEVGTGEAEVCVAIVQVWSCYFLGLSEMGGNYFSSIWLIYHADKYEYDSIYCLTQPK